MHSYSTTLNPFAPSFTLSLPPPSLLASLAPQYKYSWILIPIYEFPPPPLLIRRAPLKHNVVPLQWGDKSVMIKNIPYDFPRSELLDMLDDFCSIKNEEAKNQEVVTYCAYDFMYLPIDFSSKRGKGFAFVNFTNASAAWKFFEAFHMATWAQELKWPKKIEIVSAKLQGKEALVSYFNGSVFECDTDDFLPVIFNPPRDGSGQTVEQTVVGNRRWKLLPETTTDLDATS